MPLIICRETWNSRAISVAEKDVEQPSPKYRRTTFSCRGLRCSLSSAEMRSRSTAIWMAGYPICVTPAPPSERARKDPRERVGAVSLAQERVAPGGRRDYEASAQESVSLCPSV